MSDQYIIKSADELSNIEILLILDLWNIDEWKFMEPAEFKSKFRQSEFHFLKNGDGDLLAVSRINFDFALRITGSQFHFAEFVGLVAARKSHGYGQALVNAVVSNVAGRKLNSIGFCDKELRPFYHKCNVQMLYDLAKYISESKDGELVASTDDDIIILNLETEVHDALSSLSESTGALLVLNENS